jgi:hypothetical protein
MLIELKQLKDIANWMKAEHPAEFPEVLQGIFFMDGNVLPDYCLTMYSSEWNAHQRTLLLRIYDPVIWTFHSSMAGRILLYFVKFSRFSYLFRFSARAHYADRVWIVCAAVAGRFFDRSRSEHSEWGYLESHKLVFRQSS